jgi:hypothetical protein
VWPPGSPVGDADLGKGRNSGYQDTSPLPYVYCDGYSHADAQSNPYCHTFANYHLDIDKHHHTHTHTDIHGYPFSVTHRNRHADASSAYTYALADRYSCSQRRFCAKVVALVAL